jgi:hypothetical protein
MLRPGSPFRVILFLYGNFGTPQARAEVGYVGVNPVTDPQKIEEYEQFLCKRFASDPDDRFVATSALTIRMNDRTTAWPKCERSSFVKPCRTTGGNP